MHRGDAEDAEKLPLVSPRALRLGGESKQRAPRRRRGRREASAGPAGTEFYQRAGETFRLVMPDADGVIHSIALPGFRLNVGWLWPQDKFIPVREALQAMGSV